MMDRNKETARCLCGMCPSFVDCAETVAFCLAETGTSGCIKLEEGCLCPGCPVQDEGNFQHAYYCTRGSEHDQSAAR